MRPTVRRSAPVLNSDRAPAHPPGLGRARRQRSRSGIHLRINSTARNLSSARISSEGQQLAKRRLGRQPPRIRSCHQSSRPGRRRRRRAPRTAPAPPSAARRRDRRRWSARDGDDLAVALRLGRGDRRADLRVIVFAQAAASPSPRSAAAAERPAAAGEAAEAAASATAANRRRRSRRRPSRRRASRG